MDEQSPLPGARSTDELGLLRQNPIDLRAEPLSRTPVSRPPHATPTGDRLEIGIVTSYEDLGLIDMGGMGEVRRVRDRNLNRIMAMKIVRPELLELPAVLARFIEEAQVTAQLEHPGIVPVHEIGRLGDGRYYFTMKEVHGRTLKAVLQEVHAASPADRWETAPSGWSFRRLIDAFHKACEAVAYAHARGVVHRDLKPSNVMVGEFSEVLVMDWGLARVRGRVDLALETGHLAPVVTERSLDSSMATRVGTVTGTPTYMPPEQARGELDRLGPASDVYALGAILYELLSGRPPYTGPDGASILLQVLSGPPLPPGRRVAQQRTQQHTLTATGSDADFAPSIGSTAPSIQPLPLIGPPLPDELVGICLKAMAREPEDRYPDARALSAEVLSWLEGARRRDRALHELEGADQIRPRAEALRQQAARLRAEADAMLERIRPCEPIEHKMPAWEKEDEAKRLEREADLLEVAWLQSLRGALSHLPELPEAHERLADYYQIQHAEAEATRDARAATRLEALLRAHDTGRYAAYLQGDGAVTLITDPPRAEVRLYRYVERQRRLVPEFVRGLGRTPLPAVTLPMGSWLLEVVALGRIPVRYPVHIGRLEHWDGIRPGDRAPHPIWLPPEGALDPDEVYVPAGWYTAGGDPEALNTLPRRRIWVDGFSLRRFKATNRDYLVFLNDLVDQGREAEALRYAPRERAGRLDEQGPLLYHRDEAGHFFLGADAEGDTWHPDWPVAMVDHPCALAYARWMAERTGAPWRLLSELEWEKAARGVDGRFHPWGDFADPTWARMRDSALDRPEPARVDSYPVDESVYGVRGMGGNGREWCLEAFQKEGPPLDGGRAVLTEQDSRLDRLQVVRSCGWGSPLRNSRSSYRYGIFRSDRYGDLTLRLGRSLG